MKLLFTGASGFLGNNVRPILEKMYAVTTVGLASQDNYTVNIAKDIPKLYEHYDIVLHAAGKAHSIPRTEAERQVFFDVNLQGTKNLCTALEKVGMPRAFVFISSVAVYGCDYGENITEEHSLNGITPYAISKRLAEEYLQKWCLEHNVVLGIIRPSLIVGPNPPGNLETMITGIRKGRYFSIAGGRASKSVLMVQDIAHLIPLLVRKGGIYNVCDNRHPSYNELGVCISKQLGMSHNPLSIPYWMAWCMAKVCDIVGVLPIDSHRLEQLTKSNTYSNEKAKKALGWEPLDVIDNFKIK